MEAILTLKVRDIISGEARKELTVLYFYVSPTGYDFVFPQPDWPARKELENADVLIVLLPGVDQSVRLDGRVTDVYSVSGKNDPLVREVREVLLLRDLQPPEARFEALRKAAADPTSPDVANYAICALCKDRTHPQKTFEALLDLATSKRYRNYGYESHINIDSAIWSLARDPQVKHTPELRKRYVDVEHILHPDSPATLPW